MAESEQQSACSEDTNSICDEERVRKLFQACDGDGDGYIDSHDLLTVCRELNLEDSIEELMRELGADENGRISYEEFLRRRLALRPEIEALRCDAPQPHGTPDYLPTSSDNSLGGASAGKHESWEFDSGARDLSPEPNTLQRLVEAAGGSLTATNTASLLQLANKLHLAALASLRGEILDLSTRLHAVSEERDLLEKSLTQAQINAEATVAQQYEERLTELHSVIAELSRKMDRQRALVITEEDDAPSETEQSIETSSQVDGAPCEETLVLDSEELPVQVKQHKTRQLEDCRLEEALVELRAENALLQDKLTKKEAELHQVQSLLSGIREDRDKLRNKLREAHSLRVPSSPPLLRHETPILKVAERVKLRRMERHVTGSDITSLGVSRTEVAEQLVSELQDECDLQDMSKRDRKQLELETEKLNSRLENARANNTVLQLTLDETKTQCERLSLLVGKYESNVTALRLALGSCDRAIEVYESLTSFLDSQRLPSKDLDKIAEEADLRQLIIDLKTERDCVQNTAVELESQVEPLPVRPITTVAHARKLDLETAVLMQELMAMREDKTELRARVYLLERERESLELKLATLQSQQQAYMATVQHLQAQLHDNETGDVDGDGRENRLRERLKEVASTLERVSRNAELRQRQAAELTTKLKTDNSALVQSLERCKRKSQARLRRLEVQMLAMVERHEAQVRSFKQRIAVLEEHAHLRQDVCHSSSAASETSL